VIDACPLEPETLNGFEDDDGCPDTVPPQVAQYTGVIKGIQFRTGSAAIVRASYRTLDRAVVILEGYPSIRLRISGHTDDRGKLDRNLRLSRERADAVKRYLVGKGIDEGRLETVGHGPDKPIADNGKRAGRAQNRRIEFELLPGPAEIPDPRRTPAEGAPEPGNQPGPENKPGE
jgi:OmpA-OmpF porin, OOP family